MSASNNPDSILYAWLKTKPQPKKNPDGFYVLDTLSLISLAELLTWEKELEIRIRTRLLAIPLSTTRKDITFEDLTRGHYLNQS